jgi:hypothetical protein
MSKRFYFLLVALCVTVFNLHAQTQDSYDYQSEFTWGINKNTSGGLLGGIFAKKGIKLSEKVLQTYGLEIVNIKHPQEVRVSSLGQGNLFIYGKSNYLYAFRFQYGRDRILFKKAPQQGVEIKAVFAVGPTIGLLVPYYVQVGDNSDVPVYKKYDRSISAAEIQGSGRPFQGIGESKFKFGGNFKAALNFEMGTVKSQVTGFEVGFLLDAYTSKIEIVSDAKNYAMYPTLFIALFYGSRK